MKILFKIFFLISGKWPITIKKILPDSNSTKSKTQRTKLVCCLDTVFRNKRSILTGWNMKTQIVFSFLFSFQTTLASMKWTIVHSFILSFIHRRTKNWKTVHASNLTVSYGPDCLDSTILKITGKIFVI